jgi:F0F1-type ATP synthase assembly protein I
MLTPTTQYIEAVRRKPTTWCNGRAMTEEPDEKRSFFKDYVKAESMVQLAIAIPAGCLIGWLLGSWLDRHFHQGWIAIAGIVLGAVGGFIQIFLTASRYLKKNQ